MKKVLFAALCIHLVFGARAHSAVTLKEAFEKASSYESIEIQKSRYQQTQEQVTQAKAGVLPDVNVRGSYLTQQDAAIFDFPSLDKNRKSFQLELRQPLFQGFKEWAALSLARSQKMAQKGELEKSRLELFQQVYEVFFNIRQLNEELVHTKELLRLSRERVEFLKERVSIGRSRQSELISARSQMLSVKAQVNQLDSERIRFQERLHSLTGLSQEAKLAEEGNKGNLDSLDEYLNKALSSPWVKPQMYQKQASEKAVDVAQADHYPSLDVGANYYLYRQGTLADVDWDVTLNLTFPLYEGGETSSRVREALEQRKEAELSYRLQQKQIRAQVRTAYQSLKKGRNQLSDYRESVKLNQKNYELQQKEYSLGLVSNLDVLQALNQYIESQKELSRIRLRNQQNYYELLALTGDLFETD